VVRCDRLERLARLDRLVPFDGESAGRNEQPPELVLPAVAVPQLNTTRYGGSTAR